MNAAQYIAEVLQAHDTELVWCFPGGTISPLLDAIHKASIRVVTARNEAGAGHAAQGAYRVTGKPQVVLVTSGPGVTNACTPLADAYFDGDAIIYLMGQVATGSMRLDRPVRQRGFQEVDTVSLCKPISLAAFSPQTPLELVERIDEAFGLCVKGRPGPVVIDCPMDLQRAECPSYYPTLLHHTGPTFRMDRLREEMDLLLTKRTVVVCGRGALEASELLRELIQRTGWDVVCSMPAVGIVPSDWPQYRGMLGHTGHRAANETVAQAEALLILGARLDVRQTGTETGTWEEKELVWINRDLDELQHGRIRSGFVFWADCGEWLEQALAHVERSPR